ncbi:MAG: hypothetical protein IID40_07215 [Planctomycetes bacterium]|nr:hypothetical protein [Planctomycetota bacterium]
MADDAPVPVVGEPPTARASSSAAGFVFPGDEVTLSGRGDDPDGDDAEAELMLRWFQIAGSDVGLAGADTAEVAFVVPTDAVPGETLGFELRVTDADGNTTTDRIFLFVPRGPAVLLAIASGPEEPVFAGQEVSLSAFESLNIPAESARYSWIQIDGPPVALSEADRVAASFIAPEAGDATVTLSFELQLANQGQTDTDTVDVTVTPGSAEPDTPAEPDAADGPCDVADAGVAAGAAGYADNTCSGCHGSEAAGNPALGAPGLGGADRSAALQERFLPEGTLHNGAALTEDEVRDLACWFSTLEP